MISILAALIMLFAAGVQADTTAKIEKILMYEGGNQNFGVRSCLLR